VKLIVAALKRAESFRLFSRLSSLREGFFSRRSNLYSKDHYMKDCFVVPPRNDDLSIEVYKWSEVEEYMRFINLKKS
jgi:hypothetical protein